MAVPSFSSSSLSSSSSEPDSSCSDSETPPSRLARAAYTAAFAAALARIWSRKSCTSAGSAPLLSVAARAAQPASVICGCG